VGEIFDQNSLMTVIGLSEDDVTVSPSVTCDTDGATT